jgi:hypothetical protein
MSDAPPRIPGWQLDLADPRAPSREVWAALSAEQRAAVVDALPASPNPEIDRLEGAMSETLARIEALERAIQEKSAVADAERARREAAELRVAELEAELAKRGEGRA